MTTIAFDGIHLCADSLVTAGGVRMGHMEKIVVTKNGLVACCGDVATSVKVIAWIAAGASKKNLPCLGRDEEFTALWIDKKKRAWHIEASLIPFRACVPCALGSGGDFALAGMVSGMNAKNAVKLAMRLDCLSGGDVQEIRI